MTDILNNPGNYIPSILLILGWMLVIRKLSVSRWSIAFMGLIGTVLHEASHYVVGLLLRAKPVKVSLWPTKSGDHWILGYVSFTNLNIWNAAFVAMAPLSLFFIGFLAMLYWSTPSLVAGNYLSWLVSGYVAAACIAAGWPSSTDFKAGGLSIIMYSAIAVLIYKGATIA